MDIPRACNAATWFVDRHVAEGRAGRLAIRCGGRDITYGEVRAGANRCGNALRRLGVGMEQRVLLLLADGPEFVYAFWGALKIGAVAVPTNTLLKPRDYEYILNDSRAAVVIAGEDLAPAIETVRPHLRFLRQLVVAGRPGPGQVGLAELVTAESDELDPADTTKDDVAFWLYTSGTTGTPKAAVHLHHDMVVCCEAFGRHVLEIGPDDRCFSVARLFFAYGLGNALYFPFHVGAATVLDPRRPEPAKVFDILTRERPTLFFAVPTAFAAMLQVADAERLYDLRSVRLCLSAGEPLPKPIYERWLERFGLEILDGIGSTEMCHTFIANRRGKVCPGSSGTLVPGYDAMIVDEAGRAVPPGEIGNLLVKGDSACAGYWNQHAADVRGRVGPHWRQVPAGRGRLFLVRRPLRRHDQGGWHVGVAGRGRERPGRASGGGGGGRGGRRRCGRARQATRVRRAGRRPRRVAGAGGGIAGLREAAARRVQIPALDRVRERAAEDGDGKDPTI